MHRVRPVIAALMFLGPMSAYAEPILPAFVNESFETGDDAGWTVANPFIGVVTFGAVAGADGDFSVWFGALDNDPGSSYGQVVNGFTVGTEYIVSFLMLPEEGSNSPRDPSRTVSTTLLTLTGADVTSQSFAADCADPTSDDFFSCDPGWQEKSLSFTALAPSIDFTWTADLVNSPRSWEFGFDNVQLTLVPEPVTFLLAMFGMTSVCCFRRRL